MIKLVFLDPVVFNDDTNWTSKKFFFQEPKLFFVLVSKLEKTWKEKRPKTFLRILKIK